MAKVRVVAGARYRKDNGYYEVKKVWADGNCEILDLFSGFSMNMSKDEITKGVFDGIVDFEVMGKGSKNPDKLPIPTSYEFGDLNQIPLKTRNEALFHHYIVKSVCEIPDGIRTKASLKQCIHEAVATFNMENKEERRVPSIAQVYRWVKNFKDSGGDIRSLVPEHYKKGAKGVPRLEEELSLLIDKVIDEYYLFNQRPSIQDVYDAVLNEIEDKNKYRPEEEKLGTPSYGTISWRINQLDPYASAAARYGKAAADQYFGSTHPAPKATRPLEIAEMDHNTQDMMIVDLDDRLPIGKPTATFCIDKYSDYSLGLSLAFEPPSYLSVMQCLFNTIKPKDSIISKYSTIEHKWDAYGIPERLVVDNGKEFIGKDLDNACLQLGIELQFSPVRKPWFKGTVERSFRTFNQQFVHLIPGTTFSNVIDRGHYDSKEKAVMSFDAYLESMYIWLIDYYSEKYHKGVGGIPRKIWEESIINVNRALPPNSKELLILLSRTEYRVIQRAGIEFLGLFYNEDLFLPTLRSKSRRDKEAEPFLIKYNPADISKIWLHDHMISNGYIEIPAVDQNYTKNLSLWKHNIIRQVARQTEKEVDIYALARAKAKIQNIVNDEWAKTKKTRTRTTMARYNQLSAPPWVDNLENEPENERSFFTEDQSEILAPQNKANAGVSDIGTPISAKSEVSDMEMSVDIQEDISTDSSKTFDLSGFRLNYDLKGRN